MVADPTARPATPVAWPWPDSLDALVAAPEFHTKLLENGRVRVLHTRIPVGALVPLHTHRHPSVGYLMSCSHFLRRDQDGEITFDSRVMGLPATMPAVQWLEPLPPHTIENIGESEISILIAELKNAG